jgi:hypothetical protein
MEISRIVSGDSCRRLCKREYSCPAFPLPPDLPPPAGYTAPWLLRFLYPSVEGLRFSSLFPTASFLSPGIRSLSLLGYRVAPAIVSAQARFTASPVRKVYEQTNTRPIRVIRDSSLARRKDIFRHCLLSLVRLALPQNRDRCTNVGGVMWGRERGPIAQS